MFRVLAAVTAVPGIFWCSFASAVPFGATVVSQSTYLQACSSNSDTSTPLTVDVSSRLLVTIGGSAVTPDSSNGYGLYFSAQLFGADGTTLVAESYGNTVSIGQSEVVIADTEVLVDPNAHQPYQLAPGNYTLKLLFQTSGSCEGDGPYVTTPQLTYVLLSSAFDRIFASGFAHAIAPARNRPDSETQAV